MFIIVKYKDREYISTEYLINRTIEEVNEMIREEIDIYGRFEMEMEDGSLILGREALEECLIILKE